MSAEPSSLLTPQQRLALSREALVTQLEGGRARRARRVADSEDRLFVQALPGQVPEKPRWPEETEPPEATASRFDRFAWPSLVRGVLRRWWRRHPANAAGQLARPLIERYAREEPAKLVAVSAAGGALLVLIRPWRLLSLASIVALALKTSDVADLVTSLIQNNANPRKEPTP